MKQHWCLKLSWFVWSKTNLNDLQINLWQNDLHKSLIHKLFPSMIIKFFRRYFLNWVIIMSLMWKSTNEYPKTENYHFNCFLHKILSTVNVTWNSAASVYTLLCDGYPHISFGPITFCEYLLMKTTHVQDAFTETKQNFVLSNVNSTFFMKLLDSIVKYLLVEIFTSKDRETLMHCNNNQRIMVLGSSNFLTYTS